MREPGDLKMTDKELKNLNTAALAFMGDAVYEQAVRERLILLGKNRVDVLHRKAVNYVSAASQARIIRALFDDLTSEEQALVKRARNHRYNTRAKNADAMTYKWASAFEALIGSLFLAEDEDRLQLVLQKAFAVIEGEEAEGPHGK